MSARDFDPAVRALDRELARHLPRRRAECAALVNALLLLLEAAEQSIAQDFVRLALVQLLKDAGHDEHAIAGPLETVLSSRQPLEVHLEGRDPLLPRDGGTSFGPQMRTKVSALRFEIGLAAERIHRLLDVLYQMDFPHEDFLYEVAMITIEPPPAPPSPRPRRRR